MAVKGCSGLRQHTFFSPFGWLDLGAQVPHVRRPVVRTREQQHLSERIVHTYEYKSGEDGGGGGEVGNECTSFEWPPSKASARTQSRWLRRVRPCFQKQRLPGKRGAYNVRLRWWHSHKHTHAGGSHGGRTRRSEPGLGTLCHGFQLGQDRAFRVNARCDVCRQRRRC